MFKNKMVDMPGVHLFSRQIRRALAPQAGHDASIVVRFVKSVGCKHVKPDPSTQIATTYVCVFRAKAILSLIFQS
jgi:hypothetical protein